MRNKSIAFLVYFVLLSLFFGCNNKDDEVTSKPYDPSKPVVINTFLPDSGGLATKMTISGENFGNDPSSNYSAKVK